MEVEVEVGGGRSRGGRGRVRGQNLCSLLYNKLIYFTWFHKINKT